MGANFCRTFISSISLLSEQASSDLVQTLLSAPRVVVHWLVLWFMSARAKKRSSFNKAVSIHSISISDVSTDCNNIRQRDFVKVKAKIINFIENLERVPLKLEKQKIVDFMKSFFCSTLDLVNVLWLYWNDSKLYKILLPHLQKQ